MCPLYTLEQTLTPLTRLVYFKLNSAAHGGKDTHLFLNHGKWKTDKVDLMTCWSHPEGCSPSTQRPRRSSLKYPQAAIGQWDSYIEKILPAGNNIR